MQPYERLTSERLASLPDGSRLKLGGQIIKLTGRGSFTNSAGRTENMIEYVDSRGVPGTRLPDVRGLPIRHRVEE
ncbi:hypothetical protein [Enterobacter asburiae]|uniref:hypothetical protein n=1 Tax=Enterobacter asburiae TaxID=61645 RepID=UPI001BDF8926|nr:hypothetical protein [Enterobacter asburiae]MBT2048466.1 hypothetical protein [Enterobacter asburiae]